MRRPSRPGRAFERREQSNRRAVDEGRAGIPECSDTSTARPSVVMKTLAVTPVRAKGHWRALTLDSNKY